MADSPRKPGETGQGDPKQPSGVIPKASRPGGAPPPSGTPRPTQQIPVSPQRANPSGESTKWAPPQKLSSSSSSPTARTSIEQAPVKKATGTYSISSGPERISLDSPISTRRSRTAADFDSMASRGEDLTAFKIDIDWEKTKRYLIRLAIATIVVLALSCFRSLSLTGRYRFMESPPGSSVQFFVGVGKKEALGTVHMLARDIHTSPGPDDWTEYKISCHYIRWHHPEVVRVVITGQDGFRANSYFIPLEGPTTIPDLILEKPGAVKIGAGSIRRHGASPSPHPAP